MLTKTIGVISLLMMSQVFAGDLLLRANNQAAVSVSGHYLDYRENADDGSTLDTEKGWMPGIGFSITKSVHKLLLEGDIDFIKGDTDYSGFLQPDNRPFENQSSHVFLKTTLKLGVIVDVNPSSVLIGYLRYGYHGWTRDTNGVTKVPQSTSVFNTYVERYHFQSGVVGVRYLYQLNHHWLCQCGVGIGILVNPTLEVTVSGGIIPVELQVAGVHNVGERLHLKNRGIVTAEVGVHYFLQHQLHLFATFHLEQAKFGASERTPITSIQEPDSTTRTYQMALGLAFDFIG